MTPEIASNLEFYYDDKSSHWIDSSGTVTLNFDPWMVNAHNKQCFVHIDNDCMDSIGSLDFSYLEELILMFVMCDKSKLAERAEALLANLKNKNKK